MPFCESPEVKNEYHRNGSQVDVFKIRILGVSLNKLGSKTGYEALFSSTVITIGS